MLDRAKLLVGEDQGSMDPIAIAAGAGSNVGEPHRVFLSHTSDLGEPDEKGTFVAAAVATILRNRHAVTDLVYFAARDTSPAAYCVDMVAQSDVYVGVIGVRYGSPVRDRPDLSYTRLEFEAAASSSGWQLRKLYERLIDEEWIARRPRAARHLGWPVGFACLWQQS